MSEITRVALDGMGGDNAPGEIVKGAVEAVRLRKDIKILLTGQEEKLKNEHRIFLWDNGELISLSIGKEKNVVADRYMYIHLLKRSMKYKVSKDTNRFLIVPNAFVAYNRKVSKLTVYFYSLNNMMLYWFDVLKRKWKKITLKNIIRYFRIRQKAKRQYYK